MTPTIWDGPKLAEGTLNPVTLVRTVVARKSAAKLMKLFPPNMPNTTTAPLAIPIRLRMT
jgi:hypothetical protein